ncbi:MAG TPA: hypothetical protein VJ802_13205 [Gemmatimonadaceae bacterium]|nr:hypothetical protein [Gemmatimonadaceae bacterium]
MHRNPLAAYGDEAETVPFLSKANIHDEIAAEEIGAAVEALISPEARADESLYGRSNRILRP